MQSNEAQTLLQVVNDGHLPTAERRDAALYLVRLRLSEVQTDIPDSHPEVVKLMQPWPRTTETELWLCESWAEVTGGRSLTGFSLVDAKAAILKRRRRAVLEQLSSDEAEPTLIREAARVLRPESVSHVKINR